MIQSNRVKYKDQIDAVIATVKEHNHNLLYLGYYGSTNYGLETASSDIDIIGIVLESKSSLVSMPFRPDSGEFISPESAVNSFQLGGHKVHNKKIPLEDDIDIDLKLISFTEFMRMIYIGTPDYITLLERKVPIFIHQSFYIVIDLINTLYPYTNHISKACGYIKGEIAKFTNNFDIKALANAYRLAQDLHAKYSPACKNSHPCKKADYDIEYILKLKTEPLNHIDRYDSVLIQIESIVQSCRASQWALPLNEAQQTYSIGHITDVMWNVILSNYKF